MGVEGNVGVGGNRWNGIEGGLIFSGGCEMGRAGPGGTRRSLTEVVERMGGVIGGGVELSASHTQVGFERYYIGFVVEVVYGSGVRTARCYT